LDNFILRTFIQQQFERMKNSKDKILVRYGLTPSQELRNAMEEYAIDRVAQTFVKPYQILKPFEDFWRAENDVKRRSPDTETFFYWLAEKLDERLRGAANLDNQLSVRERALANKNEKVASDIEQNVLRELRDNYLKYPVDIIIQALTRLGWAPQVLYDENGMFAVSGDGMAPVVTGEQRLEGHMTTFVGSHQWFPTIREALQQYLNE